MKPDRTKRERGGAAAPAVAPGRARPVLNATETAGAETLDDERVASLLPAGLINDDEVVILLFRPSLLYIPLSCLTSLAWVGLVTFLLAYLAQFASRWPFGPVWSDTQAFVLGLGVAIVRLGWQGLEWYSRVYVLTDRRIIRRMGVLRVAVFQTPLRGIQHTSVFTALRERFFGLGTIGFATAGTDVFEAFWEMIRGPFEVHKVVVDTIRRYGNRG